MVNEVIPEDVKQFILSNLDTVAQCEGLLIMRANPQIEWNAESLAARLYISESEASRLIDKLFSGGFLVASDTVPPSCRYMPKHQDIEAMVSRLAELYRKYLIPITHIIHSKPKTRIQEFADAFRLRKDK